MRTNILLLIFCFGFPNQDPVSTSTKIEFEKLSWIVGEWERTNVKPDNSAFEIWQKESDYVYSGIGVSLKGTDTTFVEKLRIEIKDNQVFYVADVRENSAPTYFKMNAITDHSFISENPEHDFPKNITYKLEENTLTAIISDGGDKKMGFVFVKKR